MNLIMKAFVRHTILKSLASVLLVSSAHATDMNGLNSSAARAVRSQSQGLRMEFGLHFGSGAKPTWSLNGVPLSEQIQSTKMSCPPPPDDAACLRQQLLIFAGGTVLLLVMISSLRSHDR